MQIVVAIYEILEDMLICKKCCKGLFYTLNVFDDDTITEMIYERHKKDNDYQWFLLFTVYFNIFMVDYILDPS